MGIPKPVKRKLGRSSATAYGGSGADVFVFNRGDGTDTVTDFVNGLDVLQIANGAEKFADITVLDAGLNVSGASAPWFRPKAISGMPPCN
jgi:Ca2+-binding RTX toxin-like protein